MTPAPTTAGATPYVLCKRYSDFKQLHADAEDRGLAAAVVSGIAEEASHEDDRKLVGPLVSALGVVGGSDELCDFERFRSPVTDWPDCGDGEGAAGAVGRKGGLAHGAPRVGRRRARDRRGRDCVCA